MEQFLEFLKDKEVTLNEQQMALVKGLLKLSEQDRDELLILVQAFPIWNAGKKA